MQVYIRSNLKVNLLPHVAHNVPIVSQEMVMELAEFVAGREREYVPVATGALQSTIQVHNLGKGAAISVGSDSIDYGWFQEYGTVFHVPHPFVRPAAADGQAYAFSGDYTGRLLA